MPSENKKQPGKRRRVKAASPPPPEIPYHNDSDKDEEEFELEELVFGNDFVSQKRKDLRLDSLHLDFSSAKVIGDSESEADEEKLASEDAADEVDDLFVYDTKGKPLVKVEKIEKNESGHDGQIPPE
ncbi:hypothetical protein HK096_011660, partial [Nowakowskiella sp. JEL0078]